MRYLNQKALFDLWTNEFVSEDRHCGLCANSGKIDTSKLELHTASGHKIEVIKAFCICPNGRCLKKQGAKL